LETALGQEDYFKGYQANIDKLREETTEVEFDKMCFEVFNSAAGAELIEFLKEKVVLASVPHGMSESYGNSCIYYEGYREGYRQIIHAVKSYPERREAEEKAKLRGEK
tara:strand:+ start:3381 stop:3704 length:324 start_codon:yes stop_codon:yes gene_type:complete